MAWPCFIVVLIFRMALLKIKLQRGRYGSRGEREVLDVAGHLSVGKAFEATAEMGSQILTYVSGQGVRKDKVGRGASGEGRGWLGMV